MIEITDYIAQLIFQWTDRNTLIVKDLNNEILFMIEGCVSFPQAINFYKQIKLL